MSDSVKPHSSLPVTLGFLSVLQDAGGWIGGYLTTNSWGRPLEFRLTSAVQPNRVQTALYGPTLSEYLHTDVIGKTLVEKTSLKPDLIATDCPAALNLRSRVEVPVVLVRVADVAQPAASVEVVHARSSRPLSIAARFESDAAALARILDSVDAAVDLAEPFARVREAVLEARKMGVANRAA